MKDINFLFFSLVLIDKYFLWLDIRININFASIFCFHPYLGWIACVFVRVVNCNIECSLRLSVIIWSTNDIVCWKLRRGARKKEKKSTIMINREETDKPSQYFFSRVCLCVKYVRFSFVFSHFFYFHSFVVSICCVLYHHQHYSIQTTISFPLPVLHSNVSVHSTYV